jgi:hypothetical protein
MIKIQPYTAKRIGPLVEEEIDAIQKHGIDESYMLILRNNEYIFEDTLLNTRASR